MRRAGALVAAVVACAVAAPAAFASDITLHLSSSKVDYGATRALRRNGDSGGRGRDRLDRACGRRRRPRRRSPQTAASRARSEPLRAGALSAVLADGSTSAPVELRVRPVLRARLVAKTLFAPAHLVVRAKPCERSQAALRGRRKSREPPDRPPRLGARGQPRRAVRGRRHAAHRVRLGQHRHGPRLVREARARDDRHRRARSRVARARRDRSEAAPREPHVPPGRPVRRPGRPRRRTPSWRSRRPRASRARASPIGRRSRGSQRRRRRRRATRAAGCTSRSTRPGRSSCSCATGKVTGTLHVSTGATGNTPVGHWSVLWKAPSTHTWLGPAILWRTMTFHGGFAIHGFSPVPAYPASHGCVREPIWAANWTYEQTPVGTPVDVY